MDATVEGDHIPSAPPFIKQIYPHLIYICFSGKGGKKEKPKKKKSLLKKILKSKKKDKGKKGDAAPAYVHLRLLDLGRASALLLCFVPIPSKFIDQVSLLGLFLQVRSVCPVQRREAGYSHESRVRYGTMPLATVPLATTPLVTHAPCHQEHKAALRARVRCSPRCVTIPMAWCPCLSSSKHHAECMDKVGLDLINRHGMVWWVQVRCL